MVEHDDPLRLGGLGIYTLRAHRLLEARPIPSSTVLNFSATSVIMFNSKLTSTLTALAALTGTLAQNPTWTNSLRGPFTPISLNATDGSISAAFIPHGAAITELWVKDRNGTKRDITLGYDNKTLYADDPSHPNFGPIVSQNSRELDARTHVRPNDCD
jgi:hypothetical protein